jgi:hypothetical protein
MPNFAGGKAVQFLEALVTLLTALDITSLLVDWPDKEQAHTLPIVDLSQHILLTRVCLSPVIFEREVKGSDILKNINEIWTKEKATEANAAVLYDHVAFVRVERTAGGFYRDTGTAFRRHGDTTDGKPIESDVFEQCWLQSGIKWELDPGLVP